MNDDSTSACFICGKTLPWREKYGPLQTCESCRSAPMNEPQPLTDAEIKGVESRLDLVEDQLGDDNWGDLHLLLVGVRRLIDELRRERENNKALHAESYQLAGWLIHKLSDDELAAHEDDIVGHMDDLCLAMGMPIGKHARTGKVNSNE